MTLKEILAKRELTEDDISAIDILTEMGSTHNFDLEFKELENNHRQVIVYTPHKTKYVAVEVKTDDSLKRGDYWQTIGRMFKYSLEEELFATA